VLAITKGLDEGMPLEQAQAQAAATVPHHPSFVEWLGGLLKRK
jgi:hypothetical protein